MKQHPLDQLTKAERKQLRQNYEANLIKTKKGIMEEDYKPVVRFVNPVGAGEWYLTELGPDNIAFGLCFISYPELGYVSLDEMGSISLPWGLFIEKDRHFDCQSLTLTQWHAYLGKRR
jgi:hypothetical protein